MNILLEFKLLILLFKLRKHQEIKKDVYIYIYRYNIYISNKVQTKEEEDREHERIKRVFLNKFK